jgi:hypothetical protein
VITVAGGDLELEWEYCVILPSPEVLLTELAELENTEDESAVDAVLTEIEVIIDVLGSRRASDEDDDEGSADEVGCSDVVGGVEVDDACALGGGGAASPFALSLQLS